MNNRKTSKNKCNFSLAKTLEKPGETSIKISAPAFLLGTEISFFKLNLQGLEDSIHQTK